MSPDGHEERTFELDSLDTDDHDRDASAADHTRADSSTWEPTMQLSDTIFAAAKAHTETARVAYQHGFDAGFDAGHRAALDEALKILDAAKSTAVPA